MTNKIVGFSYFNKHGYQQYKEIEAKKLETLYKRLAKYDLYQVEGVSSNIVKDFRETEKEKYRK